MTSSEHGKRRARMEDGERRIEAPETRGTRDVGRGGWKRAALMNLQ